jgi:hypothetical protein
VGSSRRTTCRLIHCISPSRSISDDRLCGLPP